MPYCGSVRINKNSVCPYRAKYFSHRTFMRNCGNLCTPGSLLCAEPSLSESQRLVGFLLKNKGIFRLSEKIIGWQECKLNFCRWVSESIPHFFPQAAVEIVKKDPLSGVQPFLDSLTYEIQVEEPRRSGAFAFCFTFPSVCATRPGGRCGSGRFRHTPGCGSRHS